MLKGKPRRIRAHILVKAFPQPSQQYGETVCVAAAEKSGESMLRLYPIRYRRLPKKHQFDRFDEIEAVACKPTDDIRPESWHIQEDSIFVVNRGEDLNAIAKVRIWKPFICESLGALKKEQQQTRRSFGIIRPDPGTLKFFAKPIDATNDADKELDNSLFQQQALFEDSLEPLPPPDFAFGYKFSSGGVQHNMRIHDWEVQAAFFKFKRRYGDAALDKIREAYQDLIPKQNPHFIMGNMHRRPWLFIIIGILRSSLSPDDLDRQGEIFGPRTG